MRLEVVTQLPLGDKDGVYELLDLRVVGLGIGQDLTNEVHGTLYFESVSLFFPLYHQGGPDYLRGGCNVEQKRFLIDRGDQYQGLRQELLDLVKCLLGLRRPFEMVGFL